MNEHEQFLKLLDALEISREAYWRLLFKKIGIPQPLIKIILEEAQKNNNHPLEFLEKLK